MRTRCGRAVFRCVVCHFALTCAIFVLCICIGAGSSVNRKEKMCDQLLWLMMDFDANDLIRLNASVQRIVIRSFVRVTCCRDGAMATDYHDRAGLCVQWMGKVVLRAQDLLWSRENFKVLMPDGTEEETLRSQCHQRRVKFHYHERYTYKHSSTCDALEVSRRANTWLYLHCFRLGLFAVQYAGMDLAAVLAAVAARRNGYTLVACLMALSSAHPTPMLAGQPESDLICRSLRMSLYSVVLPRMGCTLAMKRGRWTFEMHMPTRPTHSV